MCLVRLTYMMLIKTAATIFHSYIVNWLICVFIWLEYFDEGDAEFACMHCGAMFWYGERIKKDKKKRTNLSFSMCCQHGKVVLPLMHDPPPFLERMFFDKKAKASQNFIDNIRQYNNMFAFTSMGGKVVNVNSRGGAPYSFVLSGMNHHNIGCLLPPVGTQPVFSQLYIYDTENEVSNRITAVRYLNAILCCN